MKKIIIGFIAFFIMMVNIKASCSDEEVIRLSKVANNIVTSYYFNNKTKKFEIIFTNVTKEMVITNLNDNKVYNEDMEFTIKNLNSGEYKFNITSNDTDCTGSTIITKYINLPYYNEFYDSLECKGIENYSYCKKWIKKKITKKQFEKEVTEYKESLNKEVKEIKQEESTLEKIKKVIIDIYVSYYYIILPLFITILCIIIYIKNSKDSII